MSKESKQLATNDLDDQNDSSPISITVFILLGAVVLVGLLGLMTGSFKVSITDGVTIDKDILVPTIMKNAEKFKKVEIAETMVKGMVVPIPEGETQADSLRELLGEHYSGELYFEDEEDFCKDDNKTPAEILESYNACRYFSSMELDADNYGIVKSNLKHDCPSLRPYVQKLMEVDNRITYIEKNKFDAKCDAIEANKEKLELLERAKQVKLELMK